MVAKRTKEYGNVLFIILIAVALFGALSFTVGNMMRGGTSSISNEQARIAAGEILQYAQAVRETVQMLRISNGCNDDEISFENDTVTGYTNANAPTDNSCHVFHLDGGGLSYRTPPAGITENWLFTGANIVDQVGTTDTDLTLILRNLTQNDCDAINASLTITAGSDPDISFTQFTGNYSASNTLNLANSQPIGCLTYDNAGNDEYFFYQVLIAR